MQSGFVFGDYVVALLELMYDLGVSRKADDVCNEFERKYNTNIPRNHYDNISSGGVRWIKNVNWARFILKDKGFLEAPRRGIWQISEKGRLWVEEHKEEQWERKREYLMGTQKHTVSARRHRIINQVTGLSYDDLATIKQVLPEEKFKETFGSVWQLMQQHKKAKLLTEISDAHILALVRPKIKQIQSFVTGNTEICTTSELPGLIEFCYWLEMYIEGAALFERLERESVGETDYIRAKKIADICRLKLH